jgi:prepilin-type N-terminal cleavage/methylation domain-containing protein
MNRTKQKGLSLLELSIALAIASAMVVLQFRQGLENVRMKFWKDEGQWVAGVLVDIEDQMGSSKDFSKLGRWTLPSLRSIPSQYHIQLAGVATGDIGNGFGGRIYAAPLAWGAGGEMSAYAVTYTNVPKYACARLVLLVHEAAAKKTYPLFGLVGNIGVLNAVPALGLNAGLVTAPVGTVLKPSADAGLNMAQVGTFCDSADPVHLTLIRRP